MKLTDHFTLEEFTDSQTAARMGFKNAPKAESWEMDNIHRTAEVMEKVRTLLGDKPILISSGYRNAKVNAAVKGSKNSAHMSGLAVDFSCPGFGTPLEICQEIEPFMDLLGVDQLIHEYATWVHLGLTDGKPRHMALTIDHKGARDGFA
jgi:hypothetical protein